MNPIELLRIKENVDRFCNEHPKMLPFFRTISQNAISEESVMEIKVTAVDGREYVSNIRITNNDVELMQMLSGLGKD